MTDPVNVKQYDDTCLPRHYLFWTTCLFDKNTNSRWSSCAFRLIAGHYSQVELCKTCGMLKNRAAVLKKKHLKTTYHKPVIFSQKSIYFIKILYPITRETHFGILDTYIFGRWYSASKNNWWAGKDTHIVIYDRTYSIYRGRNKINATNFAKTLHQIPTEELRPTYPQIHSNNIRSLCLTVIVLYEFFFILVSHLTLRL